MFKLLFPILYCPASILYSNGTRCLLGSSFFVYGTELVKRPRPLITELRKGFKPLFQGWYRVNSESKKCSRYGPFITQRWLDSPAGKAGQSYKSDGENWWLADGFRLGGRGVPGGSSHRFPEWMETFPSLCWKSQVAESFHRPCCKYPRWRKNCPRRL